MHKALLSLGGIGADSVLDRGSRSKAPGASIPSGCEDGFDRWKCGEVFGLREGPLLISFASLD
ncbi:hypothetical protein [Pleomorphochaeta sp. DL1XJH-081]|jgi:hypothetical protein|uniref:hypothetical protein n=1 Tax=Pleomorphochaeta sp. DL1XJH-081 TaxID=3409690 RepID=UPI003BB675BD